MIFWLQCLQPTEHQRPQRFHPQRLGLLVAVKIKDDDEEAVAVIMHQRRPSEQGTAKHREFVYLLKPKSSHADHSDQDLCMKYT